MTQSNKWFVTPQTKPDAEMRIFIFPYAGGGPSACSKWNALFPAKIDVQIAHYPGRGSRHNETPIKSIPILIVELSNAIKPLLDKPFVFFGHSLGGTVAFEVTRILRQNGLPQPDSLFISACGAPQILDLQPAIHSLPDDKFVAVLNELNGIPQEILQNQEMLNLFLPTLRADFELMETYKYTHNEPLNCPIVALGGLDDERVSRERLEGWATQTNARFESKYFEGGHFFINTAREAIIKVISTSNAS
ncbi:MAG: thioesterase domain-containing protein [Anaerolineales bacterium]|nr:thioesterase domain-containing protein [Anaerolineales bacterium]